MKNSIIAILTAALLATLFYIFQSNTLNTTSVNSSAPESGIEQIVVLSYGGDFSSAQRKAFFDPFEQYAGIKVLDASYGGEYGKIKAAVELAGMNNTNVPWDVVDIESSSLLRAKEDEILLPMNMKIIDTTELSKKAVDEFGIATDFYSVSLGWNTDSFGRDAPANWADFWDTERFPGPRSLKKDARFTLEIALMADGVLPAQLYENGGLDVERAFRSLDRIKKSVSVWWTSGQQPIQLLADGEIVMAAAFGARLFNAEQKESRAVGMTWNNGILDIEYWVVPKGAKNVDAAMRFINFASRARQQAELPKHIPLGPVNPFAFAIMDDKLARNLNTYPDTLVKQVFLDSEFWAKNEEALQERFNAWLTE